MKYLLILLFTGCSITMNTPSSRFISPEAQGKFMAGELGAGAWAYTRNALVTTAPGPETTPLEVEKDTEAGFNMAAGFSEKFDFIVQFPLDSPTTYGIKYQILGKPRKDAGKGNHSLAVTASYGKADDGLDGDIMLGINDADISIRSRDFSIIYGYRPESELLLYAGASITNYDFDGEKTSGLNSPGSFEYDTEALGAHLGVMGHGDKYYLKLEASLQETHWTYTDKHAYGMLAAQVGFFWN